jgi:hypothetical protein
MTRLTKELLKFVDYKKVEDLKINEEKDSTYMTDEDGFMSEIFEFTVKNFVKNLNKTGFGSRIQYIRRKMNKKFKDFTKQDCLNFLDLWCDVYENNFPCCPFGCGSDETWDIKVVTIGDKEYFEYYLDY